MKGNVMAFEAYLYENRVSPTPEFSAGIDAVCERIRQSQSQEPVKKTGNHTLGKISPKRRALVILIAAVLLLLTACAALAVYLSTVSKLKADASSQAARTEDELRASALKGAEAYANGNRHAITVDSYADIADVTLGVQTIELQPMDGNAQEAQLTFSVESQSTGVIVSFDMLNDDIRAQNVLEAFDSYCEIGIDARDFVLTVNGQAYSPYVQPDYNGMPQPAAGYTRDGTYSMIFRDLAQTISFGTNMSLSGTLYRCDHGGNRLETIGDFVIPFRYELTEDEYQKWLESLVDKGIEKQQAAADARLESLQGLPESATPIHATAEEITFLDIAATNDGFLLGLQYDLQCDSLWGAQYLTYYVNGYKVDSATIDTKWDVGGPTQPQAQGQEVPCSATLLEHIYYPATEAAISEPVTIACVRESGTGTSPGDTTREYTFQGIQFVLRYNIASGEVVLPKDDSEKASWLAAATIGSGLSSECRLYDIAGQTQMVNDVKVSIQRIATLSTGKWMVCYKIEDVACEMMAWETVPAIAINGQSATIITKPQKLNEEKTAEFLNNYSLRKNRWTTDQWEIQPPSRIQLLPESFTVDISWDLFDLTESGGRAHVGTFNFRIPVNRDAYTVTVDKAYLVGLTG